MLSPMRFEGILILNLSIEFPRFAMITYIEGRSNATSIEVYGRIDTRAKSSDKIGNT